MTEQTTTGMQDITTATDTTVDTTTQLTVDEQAIADLSAADYAYDTSDETPTPMYDFTATQAQIDATVTEQPVDVQIEMPLPTWLEGFVTFLDTYNNPTP